MPDQKPNPRRRIRLALLSPYPDQGKMFDPCSAAEDKALADDIARRGLEHPIEVMPPKNKAGLPANTIVAGHRRAAALASRGQTHAEVLIRHDLADAERAVVDAAFLSDNYERRQLDRQQRVRVAIRLFELRKCGGRALTDSQRHAARDEIGKIIGVDGRTISRYVRLSRASLAIQRAVSRGLPLVTGEKTADLSQAKQEELARRIESVDDLKQVREIVAEYFKQSDGRHVGTDKAYMSMAKLLARGVHDLDGRVEMVTPKLAARDLSTLKRARLLITSLVNVAEKGAKSLTQGTNSTND